MPGERVRVGTVRVVATGLPILSESPRDWDQGEPAQERCREIGIEGGTVPARVVSRAGLVPGDKVAGPALIEQSDTTTLLAPDEVTVVDETGNRVVLLNG